MELSFTASISRKMCFGLKRMNTNDQRKLNLDHKKTDLSKRRRIQLKTERTVNAQRRKVWSKNHGHDTYGSDDSNLDGDEIK